MSIDNFSYSVFGVSSYIIIIPILLFITLLVFCSLRRNFYIIYYPPLSAIWFTTIGSVSIWSNIFCGAKMDIALWGYGGTIFPIFLIILGIVSFIINWWKKPVYEKKSWIECIIMSLVPISLLSSAVVYRCYKFLDLSISVFAVIVIIDKLILLKHKRYFIHSGLKVLLTLNALNFMESNTLAQMIIVVTDCMLGYAFLQLKTTIKRNKRQKTKL